MAITKSMRAIVGPITSKVDPASPATYFTDTDIYFPSLIASEEISGASNFLYRNPSGNYAPCTVKNTVANILGGFSVSGAVG